MAHVRVETESVLAELRGMNEWRCVGCRVLVVWSITLGPRMSITDSDPFAYATEAKPERSCSQRRRKLSESSPTSDIAKAVTGASAFTKK